MMRCYFTAWPQLKSLKQLKNLRRQKMLLKKLRNYLVVLTSLLTILIFVFPVYSAEKTETLTFEWEHTAGDVQVKTWEMDWGVIAGGPYTKLIDIPYADAVGGVYQAPVQAVVTGQPGTHETRYFILKACGDVPQEGGGTAYQCSDPSNEASFAFWIPSTGFSAPIKFTVKPQQ